MLKAIALKDLRIEEGFFAKGATFAPGYAHDSSGNPTYRILHLCPEHRQHQLWTTKEILPLGVELDEEELEAEREKHKRFILSINSVPNLVKEELVEEHDCYGVFQPFQHVHNAEDNSSPDSESDSSSGC